MRSKLFIALVALQMIVLATLVAPAEYRLATTSTTVRLKTAPIDPVDIMRGHYAEVRYEISTVELNRWKLEDIMWAQGPRFSEDPIHSVKGTKVYVVLDTSGRFAKAKNVVGRLPKNLKNKVFIRGTIVGVNPGPKMRTKLRVTYGIEKIFISEERAKEMAGGGRYVVTVRLNPEGEAQIVSIEPLKKPSKGSDTE